MPTEPDKELSNQGFRIPDHFFDNSDDTAKKISKKLTGARESVTSAIKEANDGLIEAAAHILERISRSQDEVSKALTPLFDGAISHTEAELMKARGRKEVGNPPGKRSDPIGDQLSWEQLLNRVKDKSKLWIISSDSDYVTSVGDQALLNAFLYDELKHLHPSLTLFCLCES